MNIKMEKNEKKTKENYIKFGTMLLISFCSMYIVMFLNVDNIDHIYLSLTRLYMSLLMVSPMSVLMLVLMKDMYTNKKLNSTLYVASTTIFFISLLLLRTQTPIGDKQYMMAMIPHHSSAILTSKNAEIKDPEVKRLSQQIIQSQEEEITQMKTILRRLK